MRHDTMKRLFTIMSVATLPLAGVCAFSIQGEIDSAAAKGGGKVVVAAGEHFSDGPIRLKSNVELHLEEGAKMTTEDVREFCRGKIARYKIPKYVFFIDQFPLTGSGKIQKFRLKEMSLKLCEQQGIEVI